MGPTRAAANVLLHHHVASHRYSRCDPKTYPGQCPPVEVGAVGHHDVHRPMPQVQRVRQLTAPLKERRREARSHHRTATSAVTASDDTANDHGTGGRVNGEPAAKQPL